MPKLTNSLPKYRKHKSSGQAIVTLGGKDHYLGPHGSQVSRNEYDRLIAEWLVSGRRSRSRTPESSPTAIVEVLAAFWRFAQLWYVKNGEPTNELDAYRLVMRDVKQLYGDTPAEDFGPLAFKAVRQRWIDRGQSRSTVNKNAGRLKRLFKWAVSEELVPASVHQAVLTVAGLPKGRCSVRESKAIEPVALAVVERTLRFLPQVTADMIRFQLLTGARPGEICSLTPGDVDRTSDVWEYRVDGHKTEHHGRSRTVYIGPEGQAILTPYLFRSDDTVCFSMAESLEQRRQMRSDARVTPASCGNRRGKRSNADREERKTSRSPRFQFGFNSSSYRQTVHHACDIAFPANEPLGQRDGESDRARLRRLTETEIAELVRWQKQHRWSPNQLRHTRGTAVRQQFGLEAAQVILGHAAADVTQIYAERDAEKAREVARKIG